MWPQPSGPSSRGLGMAVSRGFQLKREITDGTVTPLIPAHSASLRAFTPVFDGLWTRVNALMAGIQEGQPAAPAEVHGIDL